MQLTSPAFREGEPIPKAHTADGKNVSPALEWADAPAGTQCFALICDDPDAPRGTWVHWVLFNIPGEARGLPEGVPPQATLADGSKHGTTDFGKPGYGGPSPPPGKPHRYFFKLYALAKPLALNEGATKQQAVDAMKGNVLAEATLIGKYGR